MTEDTSSIINTFKGDYSFLSNFAHCKNSVYYEGNAFPTAENAYQAAKSTVLKVREVFTTIKPGQSKILGRNIIVREDWEKVKLHIMYSVVYNKFSRNNDLLEKLYNTGNAELVEGNYWNDKYWGVCLKTGGGENHLGKILMRVRHELGGAG